MKATQRRSRRTTHDAARAAWLGMLTAFAAWAWWHGDTGACLSALVAIRLGALGRD